MKFVFWGESLNSDRGDGIFGDIIFLSNHRTLFDWLFLFPLCVRGKTAASLIIALKKPLKKVPFMGWLCQFVHFMFLDRDWEKDRINIAKNVSFNQLSASSCRSSNAFLLFPEGTDLSEVYPFLMRLLFTSFRKILREVIVGQTRMALRITNTCFVLGYFFFLGKIYAHNQPSPVGFEGSLNVHGVVVMLCMTLLLGTLF
jgi:hypothetical protein